jgi:hypothetical protein
MCHIASPYLSAAFLAGAFFFGAAFLAAGFASALASFLGAAFFAAGFFAAGFSAATYLAAGFLAAAFLAGFSTTTPGTNPAPFNAAATPDFSPPLARISVTRKTVICWRWPFLRCEECLRRRFT